MKKRHEKEPNHERWLLTYADLITLLMIFFVIMYASSNADKAKFTALANSLGMAMGGGMNIIEITPSNTDTGGGNVSDPVAENAAEAETVKNAKIVEQIESNKMNEVKVQLDKFLVNSGLNNTVVTDVNERGLMVSINDTSFFDSGKAIVRPESVNKLVDIGKILNQMGNYIRVEGHTDNVPIHSNEFSSNWSLSVMRASNVTELLIDKAKVQPQIISAIGYGEHRPIADNSTEVGRSKNRRVNIVVLSTKFNASEQSKQ